MGRLKLKSREWLKRYLPAEILAIIGALSGGLIVNQLFHNPILTALGGTWGENTGYYGKMLYEEAKLRVIKDGKITTRGVLKIVRNMVTEFGAAEYLDSFLIRPAAMYYFPRALGNVGLGLVAAKFAADITFYIPTIISYELKKKYLKD